MARSLLRLYELDRDQLKVVSQQLKTALREDSREKLAKLLELSEAMTDSLQQRPLVELFLMPQSDPQSAAIFASLRRISKKRAITAMFDSEALSLEGRLREFESLRNNNIIARQLDRLLNPKRLPWYLRRPGASCGWLRKDQRQELVAEMKPLRTGLPPEVQDFLRGLDGIDDDVVLHDSL
jgi:glutamine synthetase adenylyltransferase